MRLAARALAVVVFVTGVSLAATGPADLGFWTVALLPYGLVGLLLALHRPGNGLGWLLLTTATAANYSPEIPEIVNGVAILGLTTFFVLFPTGRPLSRRWSWVIGLTALGVLTFQPAAVRTLGGLAGQSGVILALGGLVTALVAPWVRYRRGSELERTQLRWLGWSLMMTAVIGLAALLSDAAGLDALSGLLGEVASLIAFLLVPLSIALALFRYRLYDIDRIISRSAAYSVLIVVLGSLYSLIALGPTLAIGTGNAPDVVVAAATLACAALFAPLRRRIVATVDRRFNRAKYQADRELESLSARLRSATPGQAQLEATQLVDRTLHPATLSVWVRKVR